MIIEALGSERLEDFKEYCRKHRMDLDDSFLYDEDLKNFKPNEENPTYVALNDQDEIVAAASLMIDDYHKRGKRGRFRILHSEVEDSKIYEMLIKEVLNHTDGLDKVFVFVPLNNKRLEEQIEETGFNVERYTFLLIKEGLYTPDVSLPEGYEIKSLRKGKDEEIWCQVRNAGFAKLQGNDTPITAEMVSKMISSDDHIEGGAMILYHEQKPVGVVRAAKDEYEGLPIVNIGPLAIIPEYQGKGLGRMLLRNSLNFAREKGYDRAVLCVNAENDRAKALYVQEGFKQVEGVACYNYDLHEPRHKAR